MGLEKEETIYTRFPGTNSLLGSPPKDMKAIVNTEYTMWKTEYPVAIVLIVFYISFMKLRKS